MQETRVQSLGREDLLEKEMATHSSILAWKIPWMEELGGLQVQGVSKSRTRLHFHFFFTRISKQAKLFWKKKKSVIVLWIGQWLWWSMLSVLHSLFAFVKTLLKKHLRFVHLCLCFVSTGKKKATKKILNSGYICILKHLKYQKCTDTWNLLWITSKTKIDLWIEG